MKNCPFCGNKEITYTEEKTLAIDTLCVRSKHHIIYNRCKLEVIGRGESFPSRREEMTKEEFVKRYNRRSK